MEYLSLNLKVFKVDDGEEYLILAENEEQARGYYENSGDCIDNEMKKGILEDCETDDIRECYKIEEINEDTDMDIKITEDIDLFNIINRYNVKDKEYLNVYTYVKYFILSSKLGGDELQVPTLIAGSVY
jgi:hypothetical protein